MTNAIAATYVAIAATPRSTKEMLRAAMGQRHLPEYEVSELLARGLIVRVALLPGEPVDGRFATVASKIK